MMAHIFQYPVYVILHKPSGTQAYNITGIVEFLEKFDVDHTIAQKVALGLCAGGNDFIPKMFGFTHQKILTLLVENKLFKD